MGGVGVFGEVLRTSSWINKLLPRELTVVVVVLLAGDQLAAAEDGHLLRVSMAPGPLHISPALVSEKKHYNFFKLMRTRSIIFLINNSDF